MIPSSALSVEHCRYGTRETTDGTRRIIPELRFVGHVNYHTARSSFFFHHEHPKVLEIFYIVRGKVSWWVEGISTEVCANELFLIWPGEWHGARDHIVAPAEYYWLQVQFPFRRPGRGGGRLNDLERDLRGISKRKLTGAGAILPLYQSLLSEHARRDAYGEAVVRGTLHLLLSLVLRSSRTENACPPLESLHQARMSRAIRWAKENVAEASLKGMVDASGLDAVSFRRHFTAAVGLSPSQYLIRLRLQNAKELLARGRSITESAHALGFSSSQYFATVFRKYEGLSPSGFLNRNARAQRPG